jgi:hypothetical protein
MPAARPGSTSDTQLCLVPGDDSRGVRMITFAGDREVLTETLVADGTPQAMTHDNCTGERVSRWAQGGSRLFFTSTLNCANEAAVRTAGLSAFVTPDQWIDIQVASVGGREQVRTRRFWRSSGMPPAPIADVVRQIVPVRPVMTGIAVDDVIEAGAAVPAAAVEAWLAESGSRVPVDRAGLLRLADAHVAENVIDLMVALAYPKKFEVRRSEPSSGGSIFWGGPMLDGFYPGEFGALADLYGFGFSPFGIGYFLGANGYYQPGGFYYVPNAGGGGGAEDTTHGQVVNGQGYTRVQPREAYRGTASAQDGSTQSSSGAGAAASGGSGAGSSSSGASPSGYSGGGGSSTGLTAVPR